MFFVVFNAIDAKLYFNKEKKERTKKLRAFVSANEEVALAFFEESALAVIQHSDTLDYYDIDSMNIEWPYEKNVSGLFKMKRLDDVEEWIAFCETSDDNESVDLPKPPTRFVIASIGGTEVPTIYFAPGIRSAVRYNNRISFDQYRTAKEFGDKNGGVEYERIVYYDGNNESPEEDLPWNCIKVNGKIVVEIETTRIEEMHGKCFSVIDHKIIEEDS